MSTSVELPQNTIPFPVDMPKPGYEALYQVLAPDGGGNIEDIRANSNPDYERYMRMHKVLVGRKGAEQLKELHGALRSEFMPHYLVAAGSAAVESALVCTEEDEAGRLNLLDDGVAVWRQAIANQLYLNDTQDPRFVEYALPYRVALDIAMSGLLREVVKGKATMATTRAVFEDSLTIAQANAVRLRLAAKEGKASVLGEHQGFGYECNALLLFNKRHARRRFMVPSLARADSGYYYKEQTHDLMIINQEWGKIQNIIPVEIKGRSNEKDRKRYHALLIRGKLHLSDTNNGGYGPDDTLDLITKDHERNSGLFDPTATDISNNLHKMIEDYCAGERLGSVAMRSVTTFYDKKVVGRNYPGVLPRAS